MAYAGKATVFFFLILEKAWSVTAYVVKKRVIRTQFSRLCMPFAFVPPKEVAAMPDALVGERAASVGNRWHMKAMAAISAGVKNRRPRAKPRPCALPCTLVDRIAATAWQGGRRAIVRGEKKNVQDGVCDDVWMICATSSVALSLRCEQRTLLMFSALFAARHGRDLQQHNVLAVCGLKGRDGTVVAPEGSD